MSRLLICQAGHVTENYTPGCTRDVPGDRAWKTRRCGCDTVRLDLRPEVEAAYLTGGEEAAHAAALETGLWELLATLPSRAGPRPPPLGAGRPRARRR